MSKSWQPKNWEEACKRNAGRRKLHMRKRKERADRIVRLLSAIDAVPELRESVYGWLSLTAETMKKSKATASRVSLPKTQPDGKTLKLAVSAVNVARP